MDINFTCPGCNQLLSTDDSMIGAEISCPSCNQVLVVPETSTTGRLTVQSFGKEAEGLIKKPNRPMEAAAKASIKIRVRTILRGDCLVEGKDRFDQILSEFLSGLGEGNLSAIHPISYSRIDPESKLAVADYGVLVIYKQI